MLGKRFAFVTMALAIKAAALSGIGPTAAATYHHKMAIGHTIHQRVRNAKAYSGPVISPTSNERYDEALSPPAGQ